MRTDEFEGIPVGVHDTLEVVMGEPAPSRERNPMGRGFAVLQWMASSPSPELTVGEIASGMGMLPSTTHRVLAMLEAEDLVRQQSNRGRYALGAGVFRLARAASAKFSVWDVAQPWVDKVRDHTKESAWFATVDSRSLTMMFRAAAESPHVLRVVRPLDEEVSLFRAGASGLLALAYMSQADQIRAIQSPDAHAATERFTDAAHLSEHLQIIRDRGYEVSASGTTGGMGIAAPVLNASDRLVGVVGIGLPASRSNETKEKEMIAFLLDVANNVSHEL